MKRYGNWYGKKRQLRRFRRQAVRMWGRQGQGVSWEQAPGEPWVQEPGRMTGEYGHRGKGRNHFLRLALVTGAVFELLWMYGRIEGSAGFLKDAVEIHLIEDRSPLGPSGSIEPLEKTGVNIRLDDGAISIFKVNEYMESGSD